MDDLLAYLDFAAHAGVDNVIFRQLVKADPATVAPNFVTRFSDRRRVDMAPLLGAISVDPEFTFQRQVMGYYYYVEVWRYRGIDVAAVGWRPRAAGGGMRTGHRGAQPAGALA
jgi:hypothetical protein